MTDASHCILGTLVLMLLPEREVEVHPEHDHRAGLVRLSCFPQLSQNPRLDSFFLRNLNVDPTGWALPDNSFDAVLCTVSVQYLQQPERVFGEVLRVLKPGGVFIVSFSNRMFFTKVRYAFVVGDGSRHGRKTRMCACDADEQCPAAGGQQPTSGWEGGLWKSTLYSLNPNSAALPSLFLLIRPLLPGGMALTIAG